MRINTVESMSPLSFLSSLATRFGGESVKPTTSSSAAASAVSTKTGNDPAALREAVDAALTRSRSSTAMMPGQRYGVSESRMLAVAQRQSLLGETGSPAQGAGAAMSAAPQATADSAAADAEARETAGSSAEAGAKESTAPNDAGTASAEDRAPSAEEQARPTGTDGEPLDDSQMQLLNDLKQRDTEVRQHEQAHMSAGQGLVRGGASFSYQTGPDGKRYAVGGEVSIDTSGDSDPEATLQKMQAVRAAALAPASPSTQDRRVAAAAMQRATQARMEIALEARQAQEQTASQAPRAADDTNAASSASSTEPSSAPEEKPEAVSAA